MNQSRCLRWGIIFYLAVFLPLSASYGQFRNPVKVEMRLSEDSVTAGDQLVLITTVTMDEGWHIYAVNEKMEGPISTEVTMTGPDIVSSVGMTIEPEPINKFDGGFQAEMYFHEGVVVLKTPVELSAQVLPGMQEIEAAIRYQACDDRVCLPPTTVSNKLVMNVVAADIQKGEIYEGSLSTSGTIQSGLAAGTSSGEIEELGENRGLLITFLLVFVGGLALNLTPCVYPLIPITVSYLGGQATGRINRSLLLAAFYVLGMALTYSILGTIAALTGSMLGSALQEPAVLIFIALVLIGLSLSMFGLYEIKVPQSLAQIGGKSRQGVFGSLFMGLTVGIIAAPCIGPFVLSLLIYVGEKGNPFLGFWLFFTLAMGLGLPFLILGTFSGMVSNLPKSGVWMVWIRKLFGIILLGMALYFVQTLLTPMIYTILLVFLLIESGIYLGWLEKSTGGKVLKSVRFGVGQVLIIAGVWMAVQSTSDLMATELNKSEMAWQTFDYALLEKAKTRGEPVVLDFYADWCVPCKELDRKTYSDPSVIEYSERFVRLKVDLTKDESEFVQGVKEKFKIIGVPTIVFINKIGNEVDRLRTVGFIGPEEFLEKMKQVG